MFKQRNINFLNKFRENNIWELILPLSVSLCLLFSMISISLFQIFLTLSFLLWLFILFRKKQWPRFPSFYWALIAYVGFSIVASITSFNPEVSFKDSKELLLFLIVPIVYTALNRNKDITIANLAFLVSSYVACLYSLFYFLFNASLEERITGFMGHYMTQAGVLLLFCCIALSLFFYLKDKTVFLWGFAFILSLVCLVLTLTRSAWLGVVVAICLVLFLYRPKILIFVPVALVLFYLFSPQPVKKRTLSIFSLKEGSNQYRVEYLKAGVEIIKEYPLFGVGPNIVDMHFQNPQYNLSEGAKNNVHLHNNIMQIGAERGIPALCAWLVFMIWIFISLIKILRNKNPASYVLASAALAALFGFNMAGLFEYNFGDSEVVTIFLYLVTIPFIQERILRKKTQA
ncbi:MAG: O-antigen ligase family protein [Candidatus Aminicenantaceae bacterium]